jgi:hypothetical protein
MVGITIKARKTRLQGSCSAGIGFSLLLSEPGRSRTPNLLIRSQVLYPVELLVHQFSLKFLFLYPGPFTG